MSTGNGTSDPQGSQPPPLTPTLTIYKPEAGQKTKVKVSGGSTSGEICVLAKATGGGGPSEVWAENYTEPFPVTPDDPPPGSTQGTCASGSSDYNVIINPLGGVECDAEGTVLNKVTVWVKFDNGVTVHASVEFYGKCDTETECDGMSGINPVPCNTL